jgi:putative acetyltransferase
MLTMALTKPQMPLPLMKLLESPKAYESELVDLFASTFTDSEGAAEGEVIGSLVKGLLADTPTHDMHMIATDSGGQLIAACAFTRLRFQNNARTVFLLSPMAVSSNHQRQGVGQKLISYGFTHLRACGVDVVLTYGDPSFYGKVGFQSIRQEDVPAPFKLQHPEGWLGLSLTTEPLSPLNGPSICVDALNHPMFW